jgi:hypothetical protein
MATDMQFVGDLIGAQIAAEQNVTNQVIINAHRETLRWARRFIELYDAVDKAAEVVTTRALEDSLNFAQMYRTDAERALERTEDQIRLWRS